MDNRVAVAALPAQRLDLRLIVDDVFVLCPVASIARLPFDTHVYVLDVLCPEPSNVDRSCHLGMPMLARCLSTSLMDNNICHAAEDRLGM